MGLRLPSGGGPANHAEWLQVNFSRAVALAEFQVVPRTVNSGYGPSTIQLVCNVTNPIPASGLPTSGSNFWSGTGFALPTLDVKLSSPVYATNAVLVVTGAYDNGSTSNPRNVQLVELTFFERALPGTFADWQLQNFTDAQLTNAAIGSASADPDGDGVPSLLEFAAGGRPLSADATNTVVTGTLAGGQLAFQFQERNALGNVTRQFQASGDLLNWTNTVPVAVNWLQNFGASSLYSAAFPMQIAPQYFRIRYSVTN